MQRLIEAAQAVVANWEHGDLAAAVRALAEAIPTRATEAERGRAIEIYADDELEIDDTAYVSESDEGVWVSAWVWLENEENDDETD